MKRHPALVSLSHQHHDGLLLAHRLQQGTRALLRLWSHDLFWQAEFVTKQFDDELTHHFNAEENILFPAARCYQIDEALVQRLIDDHAKMREYVAFFRSPEEKKLECNLTSFGKLLEDHIRCEEREFFPMCEEKIPEERWKELEGELLITLKKV